VTLAKFAFHSRKRAATSENITYSVPGFIVRHNEHHVGLLLGGGRKQCDRVQFVDEFKAIGVG
jgi:hypothetical protein